MLTFKIDCTIMTKKKKKLQARSTYANLRDKSMELWKSFMYLR